MSNIKKLGVIIIAIVFYFIVRFGVSAFISDDELQSQIMDSVESADATTIAQTTTEMVPLTTVNSGQTIEDESSIASTTQTSLENATILRGSSQGYRGKMVVDVTLKDDKIIDIIIVRTEDDDDWVDDVKRQLIPTIIDTQSADVDIVSGATFSSEGVINAVKDALSKQ